MTNCIHFSHIIFIHFLYSIKHEYMNAGLLQRKNRFRNYIKPWMKRKRLKEVKKYRSMERGVLNLKKYVHFVNDYTKKHLWKGDK